MGANALPGSFWPSERQKLLLRAALVGGDEGADAWRRLRPTFRLDDLDSASTALLPLLYRGVFRGVPEAAGGAEPGDFWEPAVGLALASVPARALDPADELLNVCVSGARTNVPPSILWVADATAVLGARSPELNWQRLV